jgi:hypothetical protein
MEVNIYQKAIEQLVLEGYTILQMIQPSGETLYFNVYRWQESYFNTAQSIDFNTVEGVNITEFLSKNAVMCSNRLEFLNHFEKEMNDGVLVRCEFTKNSIWYKWSAPNGTKNIR